MTSAPVIRKDNHISTSLSHTELTIAFRSSTRPEEHYEKLFLFAFLVRGKDTQEMENKGRFAASVSGSFGIHVSREAIFFSIIGQKKLNSVLKGNVLNCNLSYVKCV